MGSSRKPVSFGQVCAKLVRRKYKLPNAQTFNIDCEIGRFFNETSRYKTQDALIAGLGIDEATFRRRGKAVAGILERQLEREVRDALYRLGKGTSTVHKEKFRKQNLKTSQKTFGKTLESNSRQRGRIALANRIINKNADLHPEQFNEKIIPLVRRILGV
ncbi:MAG: hypothetical protein PHD95_02550 [Candidatus ainarchaeum sp.]|nr:hypothetical protein [Candidatus ainarchaeum sp.]